MNNQNNGTEGVKGAIGKPPWENLANAIILQAVEDYRKCRRRVRRWPDQKEAQAMIREIEKFFHSRWFCQLADVDGIKILEQLKKEGEALTTASGGRLVRAEVNRNKRAPLCGVAPIEVAEAC